MIERSVKMKRYFLLVGLLIAMAILMPQKANTNTDSSLDYYVVAYKNTPKQVINARTHKAEKGTKFVKGKLYVKGKIRKRTYNVDWTLYKNGKKVTKTALYKGTLFTTSMEQYVRYKNKMYEGGQLVDKGFIFLYADSKGIETLYKGHSPYKGLQRYDENDLLYYNGKIANGAYNGNLYANGQQYHWSVLEVKQYYTGETNKVTLILEEEVTFNKKDISVSGGAKVLSYTETSRSNQVEVELGNVSPGKSYTVTVKNMKYLGHKLKGTASKKITVLSSAITKKKDYQTAIALLKKWRAYTAKDIKALTYEAYIVDERFLVKLRDQEVMDNFNLGKKNTYYRDLLQALERELERSSYYDKEEDYHY